MSDYIDSIFDGINIIIDKKLEDLAYDSTEICTITNASDCKNGKYRVTDGSVSYIAYSDQDNYREGEQVRVNVPKGDFTQKKFIIGKYVTDEDTSPITYVSPLDTAVNISGNLTSILGERQFGILANGPDRKKILWNQYLDPQIFRDLQANGIYNTLIIKADFKTLLYNYNYIEGTYGLRIELLVKPSVDSNAKLKRTIELSSKEMFGNPYNFTIFSPQAKTFSIVTAGIVEGIELSLYQNGDFKNDKGEYIKAPLGMADNILVTNIELGFGSNILDVEDNVVRIYSENGLSYDYNPHSAATNQKKIGLMWYNKDENNKYLGFSDGVYEKAYDELEYLRESSYDTRLTAQKGRENIPIDELGLTLAANIEEATPILYKISSMLTQDLCGELNYFLDQIKEDNNLKTEIGDLKNTLTNIGMKLRDDGEDKLILNLGNSYKSLLKYVYDKMNEVENITRPTLNDYFKQIFNLINNDTTNSSQVNCLNWVIKRIEDLNPTSGYKEIYNNYLVRVDRVINKIYKVMESLPGNMDLDYNQFNSYMNINIDQYIPYAEKDFSDYAKKYCIYWYRYEEGYIDESDEYKLMPNGWRRLSLDELQSPEGKEYISLPNKLIDDKNQPILNEEGKETYASQFSEEQGFIYRYMQHDLPQEKYMALVCYDHSIYKSNELVFVNSQEIPDKVTLDKSDILQFEHVEGQGSSESYQIYNEIYYLRDSADEYKEREIRCHYDGLLEKDKALIGAGIYWYVPINSSMITYDKDFLLEKGFDTDEGKTLHYSKPGYVCFYKAIKGNTEEPDPETNQIKLNFSTSGYDDRSFWYKIKPYLEQNATQNHILCRVLPQGDIEGVESGEYFVFGIAGSNGTKYTFAITNSSSQGAINYGEATPLKLNISLRDANNAIVPFEETPNINWYMHTTEGSYLDYLDEDKQISIASHDGCGILKATVSVGIDSGTKGTKNRLVKLECLYSVPWSYGKYYLSGPTYIIYNNLGTLDSSSMFDSSYKLFDSQNHTEIQGLTWSIEYYQIGSTEGKALGSLDKTLKNYMPVLNNANGLTPSSLYLEGLNYVPVIIAKSGSTTYWKQPIIIMQSRYPSPLLNSWDGSFQIDEEQGTLLSTMLGAGRKNSNNTFDGVLMGNIAETAGFKEGFGLYGFNDGAQSFGLNIDGTAFFGKAGRGRIEIDGNKGIIGSASYIQNADGDLNKAGMLIDLDDGLIDILGTAEITATAFNDINEDEKRGCENYDDYKKRYGPIYIPIPQVSQSHIRISAMSPYFSIKSAQNVELMHISDNDYFLQSVNYKAGSYTLADGVKIEDGYWVKGSGNYVNVNGQPVSQDQAKATVGDGMKIDIETGKIDAYKLKIISQNILLDSTTSNGPYLMIKSNDGNNLFYVSDNHYYLKTNNYRDYVASTSEGVADTLGSGVKIDLRNGIFNAYNNFTLMAGNPGIANSVYLSTQNFGKALTLGTNQYSQATKSNWRFTLGDTFGVTADGFLFAQTGSIAGWQLGSAILYKDVYLKNGEELANENNGTVKYRTFIQNVGVYSGSGSPVSYAAFGVYKFDKGATGFPAVPTEKIFFVNNRGELTATKATITGTINAEHGYFKGDITGATGTFSGAITAGSGSTIGGWKINTDSISKGNTSLSASGTNGSITMGSSGKFSVDGNGTLKATGATVKGTIKADEGYIGDWTITDGTLFAQTDQGYTINIAPWGIMGTGSWSDTGAGASFSCTWSEIATAVYKILGK